MKKQTPRLASVDVENLIVNATYTDGRKAAVDMRLIAAQYPAFSSLLTTEACATATVADWGFTLEWSCGMSMDCERFFEVSLEQAGLNDNVRFRQWQDSNKLSLAEAAKALDLSRRTISQYRTGARPVPRIVLLACRGWRPDDVNSAA